MAQTSPVHAQINPLKELIDAARTDSSKIPSAAGSREAVARARQVYT